MGLHGAGWHRGAESANPGFSRLSLATGPAPHGFICAAGNTGWAAAESRAQDGFRPTPAGSGVTRFDHLHVQFSQRPFDAVGSGLSHRRGIACGGAYSSPHEDLPDRLRSSGHVAGRIKQGLSRGSLAKRCAGRVGSRDGMGRRQLAGNPLASATRAYRGRHCLQTGRALRSGDRRSRQSHQAGFTSITPNLRLYLTLWS
jgi:hypothetical protein